MLTEILLQATLQRSNGARRFSHTLTSNEKKLTETRVMPQDVHAKHVPESRSCTTCSSFSCLTKISIQYYCATLALSKSLASSPTEVQNVMGKGHPAQHQPGICTFGTDVKARHAMNGAPSAFSRPLFLFFLYYSSSSSLLLLASLLLVLLHHLLLLLPLLLFFLLPLLLILLQ